MADAGPAENKQTPVTGYPQAYTAHPPYQPYQSYPAHPYPAHPYPGPPPPYPAYPYPQPPPQPYAPQRTLIFRRLVVAMIAIFITLGAISLIVWLVLRPHIPKFSLVSASVSPFNLSSNLLTANWDLSFHVDNPNAKMGIFYDRLQASVFHGSEPLAQTALPPFYQGKRNSTTLEARLAAVSEYVDPRPAKDIAEEKGIKGEVKFDVRMVGLVRFRAGAWTTRRRVIRVYCEDVRIGFAKPDGPGRLAGNQMDCNVDL